MSVVFDAEGADFGSVAAGEEGQAVSSSIIVSIVAASGPEAKTPGQYP